MISFEASNNFVALNKFNESAVVYLLLHITTAEENVRFSPANLQGLPNLGDIKTFAVELSLQTG